jgi:hypothetical protein
MQMRMQVLQEIERIKTLAWPMGYEDVMTIFDDRTVILVLRKIIEKEEEKKEGA